MISLKEKLQKGNKQGAKKEITATQIKTKNKKRIIKAQEKLYLLKNKLAYQSIKQRNKKEIRQEISSIINILLKLYKEI